MMKWNFTMVMFTLLVVALWCGVVTNAQDKGSLKGNTKTIIVPTPSIAVGNTNLPRTTSLSHFAGSQTTLSHHSTITATRTIGNSSMSVNATTVLPPSHGPRERDDSKLGFIIGCIAAAVGTAIVVTIVTLLYMRRKRCKQAASNREKNRLPFHVREMSVGAATNLGADELGDNIGDVRHEHREEDEIDHVSASRNLSLRSALPPRTSSRWPEVGDRPASPSLGGTARRMGEPGSPGFHNSVAEEEGSISMSELKERRSRTVSKRPGLVKKIITTGGGEIKIEDITLNVGAGCLDKDIEITLIKDDQNFAFKSLHDLGLVDAAPRVVEFLPDGLKFSKPADLTIRFENPISDSELFILHGSYNRDYQRTVWELVTNDIEDNKAEGVVSMKINGFCFYSYLVARRGRIARILSHLNNSFTCRAYALYRRSSPDTIDISVVFVSKFVDDDKEEDIKQLRDHFEAGYVKGEKGILKGVHTDRRLEMSLQFPEVPTTPISFKVDKTELDDDGFAVDLFKEIPVKSPASGKVKISEVHRSAKNKLLWSLNVREIIQEQIKIEKVKEQYVEPDAEPEVVYRTTKLTTGEISRMSLVVGVDWDSLAGLLDIPYSEREEIRVNDQKFPNSHSKAEQIFELFNDSRYFCRLTLEKCVEELERQDLKDKLRPVEKIEEQIEPPPSEPQVHPYENVVLRNTPLSPREMHRLSRRITVDWDSLAGLMDIAKEERNDIRQNTVMYKNHRDRAEKILSLFNHKRDFSREKLADCLKGIHKDELISPIKTGQWRNL